MDSKEQNQKRVNRYFKMVIECGKDNKNKAMRFFKEALDQDSNLLTAYDCLAELEPSKSDVIRKLSAKWR